MTQRRALRRKQRQRTNPTSLECKGIKIEDLRGFTRPQFLKEILPRLRIEGWELPRAHSGKPPELA
jgi:hypothetical protein